MKIAFWLLLILWLCSIGLRFFLDGMASYTGSPSQAFLGRRFLEVFFALEMTVVFVTGWLLYTRTHFQRVIGFGLTGMFLLPILHFFSMDLAIGYTVKGSVGGQMHEVDWIYRPWYIEQNERLSVIVSYPGYRPTLRDNTWRDLQVTISKTSAEKPYFSTVFEDDADQKRPECLEEPANTYCRFFVEGAWYYAHHKSAQNSAVGPELQDMMRDVPALFDGFKNAPENLRIL